MLSVKLPVLPCDHFPIFSSLTSSPLPPSPLSDFSFRCLKSISISKCTRDTLSSRLITHSPTDLCDIVDSCNTTFSIHFLTNMFHSRPKVFELNLRILASHLPCLNQNLLIVILKNLVYYSFHPRISIFFALPPTRITLPLSVPTSLQLFTHLIIIIIIIIIIIWSSQALELYQQARILKNHRLDRFFFHCTSHRCQPSSTRSALVIISTPTTLKSTSQCRELTYQTK